MSFFLLLLFSFEKLLLNFLMRTPFFHKRTKVSDWSSYWKRQVGEVLLDLNVVTLVFVYFKKIALHTFLNHHIRRVVNMKSIKTKWFMGSMI